MSDVDPFLAEAERRGLLTAAQADECGRVAASMAEVQAEMAIDEIAVRKGFLAAPQAAEIRRALARRRVGRYEVIGKLGEGAAGVVWKARDSKLDRVVALKVLSQKAQTTPEFRERFLAEARIAVTLNHVNIARGLEIGEADGYQYFAMEFIEGENAETRLARLGRLPEKAAVAIALDVVHALSHVQKLHIVHRDIKPGNLMITLTGHAKLCDLGLAKPFLAQRDLTEGDGSIAGTPYYMSPEQIRDPENIDWKSDVYSLGATLYHLLTGVPPFRPDANGGVIQKHLKEKPKNPREHVLELSDGVSSVVLRMLQKAPADRYESLDELTADLESVLAGRAPLHVAPPPPPEEATAERHARHAMARRITAETLPREAFPWQALAVFAVFVGGVIAVAVGRDAADSRTSAQVATAPDPSRPTDVPRDPAALTSHPRPRPPKPSGTSADPELERRAQAEFDARWKLAQTDAEAGRYTAAQERLVPFPAEFQTTEAARQAAAEAEQLKVVAAGRCTELMDKAKDAARRHRFDDARALIVKASRVDWAWAEGSAKAAGEEIEAIARQYDRGREEQAAAFADLYGRALLAAGKDGLAAARAVVDDGAKPLDAYDDDTKELRRDLDLMETEHVDVESTRPGDAKIALAIVLAHLSRGDLVRAEQVVDAVREFDGDEDAARHRVEMVRTALARRATDALAGADSALAAGRHGEAYRIAEEALKLLPEFAPTRVMLGRIRLDEGRLDDALRWLADAAGGRSAPPEAHLWYGRALLAKRDDLARAEAEFREFLDDAPPKDPQRPSAEADLKRARSLRLETETKRWRDAAKAAARKGDNERAEGAWGRVVESSSEDPDALLALGQIYFNKGWNNPAFVLLSRLVKLPSVDATKKTTADGMLQSLKKKGAFATGDGVGTAGDADRYFAGENWSKAIDTYQAALAVSPYLSAARATLVRALLARFREDRNAEDARSALAAAEGLVSLVPEDATLLALRSSAHLAVGDTAHALADAAAALASDGNNPAAALAKARALLANGETARAKEAFRAAYSLGRAPAALLGLARCLADAGDFEGARDALDTLKERHGVPRELRKEFDELMQRCFDGK